MVAPRRPGHVDADGTVHLLGRGALCINTGGEKVYPEEVEAVLKNHPAVGDAVVLGAPDDRFGQRVVAVIATVDGLPTPDLEALQAHCREHLAGYKVPRALHVVDEIPRSPAGKADYASARASRWGSSAIFSVVGVQCFGRGAGSCTRTTAGRAAGFSRRTNPTSTA